jgi:large subunit ribosomal protein L5
MAEKKTEKAESAEKTEKPEKPEKKAAPAGKGKREKDKKAAVETAAESSARAPSPVRLRVKYQKEVIPALMKEFGYKNPMQVPRINKVVVNMGLGEAIANNKILDGAVEQLGMITGQKAVITRSRKSIANFKLRENQAIGAMVTLRSDRMFEFLDRLMNIALPRVRDFKGVSSKAFDGAGNYTLGVREQIIFPEINYDQIEKVKGMNITVVTSANTDEEGRALLRHLGMPFRT